MNEKARQKFNTIYTALLTCTYDKNAGEGLLEMARLIDGAIEKAQELGIETDTPEQIASYKKEWNEQ